MYNFGVYAGENIFAFHGTKPIVLVGGMNGRGKTTFLEAVLLALYGSNSAAYRESRLKSYEQYLRNHVNQYCEDQRTFVELEFVMRRSESSREEYRIRREWNLFVEESGEVIQVEKNGEPNEFLTENWLLFVENILPSALSSFYFFNGEKIVKLAADHTSTQLKESIRSMLGITVLDVLKKDIDRSLRKNREKIKEKESLNKLEVLRQECEHDILQLEKIELQMEKVSNEIQEKQKQIEKLHRQFEIAGGEAVKKRETLICQKADLQSEILKNEEEVMDAVSGELPMVLVKNLVIDIKGLAEDEHNFFVMQEAMAQIGKLLSVFSENHAKEAEASKQFMDFIREQTLSEEVEAVFDLSDHARFQANTLLEVSFDQSKENVKKLLEQKKILNQRLDEVENYLSFDIDEKVCERIRKKIQEEEKRLSELKRTLFNLQQTKSLTNGLVSAKTAEFNHLGETYLKAAELYEDGERLIKYSHMAQRILREYIVRLQKRKTEVLGKTITECYKKLANKKNLIQEIEMNPRTLDLQYRDEHGNPITIEFMSAGEKQLMVISILWALAICSKKKLPVIIDTPLSRLDSLHRTSLVTTYFPQASEQTIILSTDSEIDHDCYELMKDSIGDEFTLKFDEESKSTTIEKGYFKKE